MATQHKAPAKGTVVKKARVDEVIGEVFVDWLDAVSRKGPYNIMVFESGAQIQVPGNYGTNVDLVIGEVYSARWSGGTLVIVQGSELPADENEDSDSENEAF